MPALLTQPNYYCGLSFREHGPVLLFATEMATIYGTGTWVTNGVYVQTWET